MLGAKGISPLALRGFFNPQIQVATIKQIKRQKTE
jgi:hypothetical protein